MAIDQKTKTATSQNKYIQDYLHAQDLIQEEQWAKGIAAAKRNLTDTSLPRYWQVRNCILIINAKDDWHVAEDYRKAAEEVWAIAKVRTAEDDLTAHSFLNQLRDELDELAEIQISEAPVEESRESESLHGVVAPPSTAAEEDPDVDMEDEEDDGWEVEEDEEEDDEEGEPLGSDVDILAAIRSTRDRPQREKYIGPPLEQIKAHAKKETEGSRPESDAEPETEATVSSPETESERKDWALKRWFGNATDILRYR
ncbi:Hypothetical predicted protein [Lecanosticta acicola]|uniref:Uncharacterized protein n=1 Tax=Lecanosticta acicola TaxID=111012 RepID=A0AAI9E4P9_9PEZI|nr:Hypothetical predicted protein [Lecanosticta acicola]